MRKTLEDHEEYCNDGNDPVASAAHYMFHNNRKDFFPTCEKGFEEYAMYKYREYHGSLDGYEYKRLNYDGYDCESTDDLEISWGHFRWHQNNGTPTCDRSKAEKRMAEWFRIHPEADMYEAYGMNGLNHEVYKFTFESDGAVYYGCTSQGMKARRTRFRSKMKKRIESGDPYIINVLAQFTSKDEARLFEKELIQTHRGTPILNVQHVREESNEFT